MHPLLYRNHAWAADREADDPGFFERISSIHAPHTLYIGCSDARVPANLVTDTGIGEMFVHRNIANQARSGDPALSASLQYAVEVLGVRDIVVCGHEGCGGVRASVTGGAPPAVEAWLEPLRLLARVHRGELQGLPEDEQVDRLVALNVLEQIDALCRHPVVQQAWSAGSPLVVHGWVYALRNGRLKEVVRIDGPALAGAAK